MKPHKIRPITSRESAGLIFCGQFYAANDQLPTVQAVCDNFGWASPNAARDMLLSLCRKGYLERNLLGKLKFTAKGRAFITEQLTYARWHPIRRIVATSDLKTAPIQLGPHHRVLRIRPMRSRPVPTIAAAWTAPLQSDPLL